MKLLTVLSYYYLKQAKHLMIMQVDVKLNKHACIRGQCKNYISPLRTEKLPQYEKNLYHT
jgi:hypothetical protein